MKRLLPWLAPLVLCLTFAVADVKGQATPPSPPGADAGDLTDKSAAPLPWAVAVLFTLVILTIVCVPTRKG
jgi:hypothetical protein